MENLASIRTRLQAQATARFNCEIEGLGPETGLFINMMTRELYQLHSELSESNDAIQKRIEQRLRPDVKTRPRPAHALAYAQPQYNKYVLNPKYDVFNMNVSGTHDLFFAPLLPVPLIKGEVKYIVAGQKLNEVKSTFHLSLNPVKDLATTLHEGVLWVGVYSEAPLPQDQPLCFYANWSEKNKDRLKELNDLLSLVDWIYGDKSCATRPGIWIDQNALDNQGTQYVDEAFMYLYDIEKSILQTYNSCFIQVEVSSVQKTLPPAELSALFETDALNEMVKEELTWFKLVFPHGVEPTELQGFSLHLNCFPVLNRRLEKASKIGPFKDKDTEIILLDEAADEVRARTKGTEFLGIQSVFSKEAVYKPIAFDNFKEALPGFYVMQHGRVEVSIIRDLQTRVQELTDLMSTSGDLIFRINPDSKLKEIITDLQGTIKKLETALNEENIGEYYPAYYLHLKVRNAPDVIYAQFWITQGKAAQGACMPGRQLTQDSRQISSLSEAWIVG